MMPRSRTGGSSMIQSRHPVARVALVMTLVLSLFSLSVTRARAATAASISLKPAVGPPTIPISVKGSGFDASEVVDISFDTSLVGTAIASPDGSFTKSVKAPRTATPGSHTVTATGESSGFTATGAFLVRTNWPRFHFDNASTGFNPYENVLSTSNVATLVQKWSMPTAEGAAPDPIVA